jgi:uncharacterized protein (TIGR02145 family)
MQEFTDTHCSQMASYPDSGGRELMFAGEPGAKLMYINTVCVRDSRDGKPYRVRKLKDNKCWMIDNLMYSGGSAVSANPISQTYCQNNVSYSTPNPKSSGKWVHSTTGCEYLYPWETAASGTGDSQYGGPTDPSKIGRICPAGWKLPTRTTYENLLGRLLDPGAGETIGNDTAFQATFTGAYENGVGFYDAGALGLYWTATLSASGSAYRLRFNIGGESITSENKILYHAVRCHK